MLLITNCMGASLIIKAATLDDLDQLVLIEKRAFEVGPYSRGMLKRMLGTRGSFHFVAADNDVVIGYASAIPIDEATADVESIAVDPAQQGKGIGGMLLGKIEDEMRARGFRFSLLEVRDMNAESISFYRKHGYEEVQHINTYYHEEYRGSRGAYRMRKIL